MKIYGKRPLFRGIGSLRDVRNLLRKSRRHLAIAVAFGDFHTLIQLLERPRNFALAEKHTNLAKDACVELSFFGGIHEGKFKQPKRNSRFHPRWFYPLAPANPRLSFPVRTHTAP